MAITIDDFSKIWASTSPLTPYEFSEDNYKSGWNFIGSTPPSRQMWDFLQKNNDEKMQYLAKNYLPLSGGTINGELTLNTSSGTRLLHLYQNGSAFATLGVTGGANAQGISLLSKEGSFNDSYLSLSPSNKSTDPNFVLAAGNGTTAVSLVGRPNGTLTWVDKEVERVNASGTNYIRYESGFQICWERIGNVTTSGTTVTLPASFVGDYGLTFGNGTNAIPKFSEITTTSFKVTMTTGTDNVRYVAIGRWK